MRIPFFCICDFKCADQLRGTAKLISAFVFEPRYEKTDLRGFGPGRHKPDYTVTEDGERLEISDLGSRGFVL